MATKKKKGKRSPSKYSPCKENPQRIRFSAYITYATYQRIIASMRTHDPPFLSDFFIDNIIKVCDEILEKNPELLTEIFQKPEMYHPEKGEENIFKPKKIIFEIEVNDGGNNSNSTKEKI